MKITEHSYDDYERVISFEDDDFYQNINFSLSLYSVKTFFFYFKTLIYKDIYKKNT